MNYTLKCLSKIKSSLISYILLVILPFRQHFNFSSVRGQPLLLRIVVWVFLQNKIGLVSLTSCFYFFSGAEDKHGYLWDRHYGIPLQKFPHDDVVNSVAFNPCDPETLVTVSDDFTIKIWRSRNREKELK